jgi:hypothetical protein
VADAPAATDDDVELLDRIAQLTCDLDPPAAELHTLFAADPRLRVPETVTSHDPLGGSPRRVTVGPLDARAAPPAGPLVIYSGARLRPRAGTGARSCDETCAG